MLKRIWNRVGESRRPTRASRARAISQWDALESRRLMTSGPTDYVLSGESWANPSKITYSFPPDGTPWDGGTNDLNAVMSADYPAGNWQRIIAEALQTWASVANINVVPVADGGEPFNTTGLTQGDPRFGDIRVGGYNFDSSTVLAQSYNPPPNGITGAGDVEVNTGFTWGPTAPYDLYSVLLHETGLALGMGETTDPTAVMNRIYGGVRFGLEPVDINGIQAIYGPRLPDQYQAAGAATSAATAYDVSGGLATIAPGVEQATLFGVSLDAIGDTEYFSVVAPAGGSPETLYAIANSQGISSLSPKVTIYNTPMQPLGTAGDPDAWSDRQYATATGLVPGQRYIIAVTARDRRRLLRGRLCVPAHLQGDLGRDPAPDRTQIAPAAAPGEPPAATPSADGARRALPDPDRRAHAPERARSQRAEQHRRPGHQPRHAHHDGRHRPDLRRRPRRAGLHLRAEDVRLRCRLDGHEHTVGRELGGPDGRHRGRPGHVPRADGRLAVLDRDRADQRPDEPGVLDGDRGRPLSRAGPAGRRPRGR